MVSDIHNPTLVDGRYRLDVELGAGAFGKVYKAIHEVMGKDMRAVALKLFFGDAINLDNVEQMMKDALEVITVLENLTEWEVRQHFVTVYDLGVTREEPRRGYVAMELVRGGSLEGRLKSLKKFTVPSAFHYMHQISRALAYMHSKRFVHSDLKPANVLTYRGKQNDLVKIGDFGLAGRCLGLFADGPRGGTMSYMAPEALMGVATTPGCDVFSMGVIGYELLHGSNPYDIAGASLDRDAHDYNEKLNRSQLMARDVPLTVKLSQYPELVGELERYVPFLEVVNKMLQTDVSLRYASATEVYKDLDRIDQGRLPTLNRESPKEQQGVAPPPADDPMKKVVERFDYHLAKQDWGEATKVATQTIKATPDSPVGYRLKAQVLRKQADVLASSAPGSPQANRFRAQAITGLNRGIDACSIPSDLKELWLEIAEIHHEMGEYETAKQIRHQRKKT